MNTAVVLLAVALAFAAFAQAQDDKKCIQDFLTKVVTKACDAGSKTVDKCKKCFNDAIANVEDGEKLNAAIVACAKQNGVDEVKYGSCLSLCKIIKGVDVNGATKQMKECGGDVKICDTLKGVDVDGMAGDASKKGGDLKDNQCVKDAQASASKGGDKYKKAFSDYATEMQKCHKRYQVKLLSNAKNLLKLTCKPYITDDHIKSMESCAAACTVAKGSMG